MDLYQGLITITLVHFLAAASPGPDFVLVSRQALVNGRRAAIVTSAGITLGLSVHIIYSVLGLAVIIAHSSSLLLAIKILGGGYLLYLGYQGLKSRPSTEGEVDKKMEVEKNNAKQFFSGVICNVLNPKAPIYFVSVFTIVLSPDLPMYQLVIYGVWMMFIQFLWFAMVSYFLSTPKVNQRFRQFSHWLDRVFGGAMMLLGVKVLMSNQ